MCYFHSSIRSKGVQNPFLFYVENGVCIDNFKIGRCHFLNHFRSFKGAPSSATKKLEKKFISQGKILSLEQNIALIKSFIRREIKLPCSALIA